MNSRLVALVGKTEDVERVKHFQGMPPELTNGVETRKRLPWPRVLLIEERADGIFLFRFTESGIPGGDTCHLDIDEAKEQAEYEYADLLTEWRDVPPDVADPVEYALLKD